MNEQNASTQPVLRVEKRERQNLRRRTPLQLRKVFKNSLGSFLKVLFIGGLLTIAIIFALDAGDGYAPEFIRANSELILSLWLIALVLILFSRTIYEYLHYRTYFYDIVDDNVIIRKGVLAQREVTLPISRITDVYVAQDLLDVLLGLYDVQISTPTQESGAFAHINGLNKRGAHRLKQELLDLMKQTDLSRQK